MEKQKENERRERERVFSDQFSEDIKNFKEQGHITSKSGYVYLSCWHHVVDVHLEGCLCNILKVKVTDSEVI